MLVVVGGHTRNIGKTSVAAGIIRGLPEFNWTALKITQFGHGVCSANGLPCACSLAPEHPWVMTRELKPGNSDSGRFLAAGARESYWLRTAMGQLRAAIPNLRDVLAASTNAIVESNSVIEFLAPDLYLVVLDLEKEDFKLSSRRFLERADAFVVIERGLREPAWKGIDRGAWQNKRQFRVRSSEYASSELCEFVKTQLAAAPTADGGVAGH